MLKSPKRAQNSDNEVTEIMCKKKHNSQKINSQGFYEQPQFIFFNFTQLKLRKITEVNNLLEKKAKNNYALKFQEI
jgi:hypothetical protein